MCLNRVARRISSQRNLDTSDLATDLRVPPVTRLSPPGNARPADISYFMGMTAAAHSVSLRSPSNNRTHYADIAGWERYQTFFPEAMRCTAETTPREEWWSWNGLQPVRELKLDLLQASWR
jgi:hypothetical protein